MHQVEDELRLVGRFRVAEPTEAVVDADVRRGQRALRRRRLRATGAAAVTVCIGGAVVAGVLGRGPASARYPSAPPTAVRTNTPSAGSSSISLVSYRGPQYPGFEVARVPSGFVLQGVSGSVLSIARPENRTPIGTFVGKLVITIEAQDEARPQDGSPVTVNGAAGTVRRNADGTATLSYAQGTDLVQIQAWHDVPMSNQQLVRFAEGVTVTARAQRSHG